MDCMLLAVMVMDCGTAAGGDGDGLYVTGGDGDG